MNKLSSYQIRFVSVLDTRNSSKLIYQFASETSSEDYKTYLKEYQLMSTKSANFKIKTSERVPVYSQLKDFKWYLTKDRYSMLYFFLVLGSIDEEIVFRLQTKIQIIIDRGYEDIVDENQEEIERAKEAILFQIQQFNSVLNANPQADILIESENEIKEIIKVDGIKINLEGEIQASQQLSDSSNFFIKETKRKNRLLCMQLIVLVVMFLTLILGILDALMTYMPNVIPI